MFDPRYLDSYPLLIAEKVRLSDTDRQGHVNNVAFSYFLEAGRAAIVLENEGLLDPDCFFVIVTTTIDYVGELHYPGTVTVAIGMERIGKSSFTVQQALFQDARCASLSHSTMVQMNFTTKASQPLSDKARTLFTSLLLSGSA
jgi:acyl-CoA thioester hydrolase